MDGVRLKHTLIKIPFNDVVHVCLSLARTFDKNTYAVAQIAVSLIRGNSLRNADCNKCFDVLK